MAGKSYETKRGNQLTGWCATIPAEMTADELKTWMNEHCSKWVFQLEEGKETGYRHYQATFNLKARRRLHEVAKLLGGRAHLSPIADSGAWAYSAKSDTRVDGPWTSTDIKDEDVPADCKEVYENPYDWQVSVVDILQKPWSKERSRQVHIIIDPVGNNGKSTLVKYLLFHKVAGRIAPADCKSMRRAAYCFWETHKNTAWCIDLPRQAVSAKLMAEFWSGIEQIKNGAYEDDRHKHREAVVTTPNVVVFANYDPTTTGCLSEDRVHKHIIYEGRLIDWTEERMAKVIAKAEAKVGAKRSRAVAHDPIDDE